MKLTKGYKPTFNLKNRETKVKAYWPGHRYIPMEYVPDLHLKSSIDGKIIGRPHIYVLGDEFSTLIAGMHIGIATTFDTGLKYALYNSAEDKRIFCRKYGIEISEDDWPETGIPKGLVIDRGEISPIMINNIVGGFNIVIENGPYRPVLKGMCERIGKSIFKNLQYKYIRDAIGGQMDINEFTKLVIEAVINYNKSLNENYVLLPEMIKDGINPCPIEIWNWGIKNISGGLRKFDEEHIKRNLLGHSNASLTEKGLRFCGLLYNCDVEEVRSWYPESENNVVNHVKIYYDVREIGSIYVTNKTRSIIRKCHISKEFKECKNMTFDEIQANQRYVIKTLYKYSHSISGKESFPLNINLQPEGN